jgi:CRISPR-associated protein Cas6
MKKQISFQVTGNKIPLDHRYFLHSAIKKEFQKGIPGFDFGTSLINSIPGMLSMGMWLKITPKSTFQARVEESELAMWETLNEKRLNIGGSFVQLSNPVVKDITPAQQITSAMVLFHCGKQKLKNDIPNVEMFLASCYKALGKLDIKASVKMGELRKFKCKGRNQLGYKVELFDLSEDDSIKVKSLGLGGSRRFGCGWFNDKL